MSQINAIVDIGNSKIKLAFFNGLKISSVELCLDEAEVWNKVSNCESIIVSSVRDYQKPANFKGFFHDLGLNSRLPFISNYESPKTLGADRLALAAAAVQAYDKQACLVIDAGTCITYDLIHDKTYLGGAISPGWHLRAKSMNAFTGKLPLVSPPDAPQKFPGLNTTSCLQIGVQQGFQAEIESFISSVELQYPSLKVVLTGGDAKRFELPSNNRIFADPNFLLKGLNYILLNNVQ